MTDNELLEVVEKERNKFSEADDNLLKGYVDELVKRGVYPQTPMMLENEYDAFHMMEGWGAYWHQFRGLLNCPHCQADLRSPSGPPFKRELGFEDPILYDGVAYEVCPDCKGAWTRQGTPLTQEEVKNLKREEIFTK